MRRVLFAIDAVSIWTGKAVSWMILLVVLFVVYEILMRYVFRLPTLWVSESMVFGCGVTYVLGAAWTLQDNRHVKIDMIYGRLRERQRAVVDSITFVWDPPVYPIKVALAVGVLLLLFQGIAKFVRDLHLAVTGKEL
jgi:TRAP-type mannitol/chloroaromatic compound transport system permease small subunit